MDVDLRYQPPQEEPCNTVKFVYRQMVVQIIQGNGFGEVTVISADKDIPFHEVQDTVKGIANS